MELVIDANILFAALIKDGTTATLLFHEDLKFYSPEFVIDEFLKYSGLIQKKMKRTGEEFMLITHQLYQVINVIPEEEYEHFIDGAKNISPDDKDVMYFALALKMKCGIWSNDRVLKEQDTVVVYTTKELLSLLG